MHFHIMPRCLTRQEVILQGLTTGKDAPLTAKKGGIAGRGVFAEANIPCGSWLCEYKATHTFPPNQRSKMEEEYERNHKGSYIVESSYAIPGIGRMCWDATRYYHQVGRYINHAQNDTTILGQGEVEDWVCGSKGDKARR